MLRKSPLGSRAWVAVLATVASLTVAIGITAPLPAVATLAGSSFNALDKTPDAGAHSYADPTGSGDVSNFSNGSKEDDLCPGIASGTASPKDDLNAFYFGSDAPDHVFLYLGWHRISVTGTTTIDFELNQSNLDAPSCSNGLSKSRTAGDLLLTYDFQGTGPFTLDTSMRSWVGNATSGHWGDPQDLSNLESEASISDDGQFGEMVVDLTAAGIFQSDVCKDFGNVYSKTRSSSTSFSSSIKDFTAPVPVLVSNCGHISVHKTDDAGTPLAGVTFTLSTDVNGVMGVPVSPSKSCTTDADGSCNILDILAGTYWVAESNVPAGHTAQPPRRVTVGVASNSPANPLEFVNPRQPAAVNIVKHDDTGAALAGATFGLYTDNAGTRGTAVSGKTCLTSSSGLCSITNILPPGTYWVHETVIPTGYSGADDQSVTLGLGQTVTLTFVDTRKPARVNIVKHDDNGAAVSGATFGLYHDNDGARGTTVSGKTCTTDAGGLCSITNILPPGTYWVHETVVPAGYTGADDQSVTLDLDQTVTLTFVDVRKPATVNIVKHDDTGAVLAGATFGLYTDTNGAIGEAVAGKSCTTDASGECSIGDILPPGTYWVHETAVPNGYTTADDQSVVLGLNQTVTLTFSDGRIPARVDIIKHDDMGAALAGATFGLYNDSAGSRGSAVAGKSCTTGASGTCSIANILPPGTYWLHESVVPTGYTGADDQKVTLGLNQTVELTFVDVRQPGRIDIVKHDDNGAALSGATFGLFNDSAGSRGNAVAGKSCTTGANGTCSITSILPPATYWVHETVVPAGYGPADDQKVTVGLNQTVSLTFVDPRSPARLNIVKHDDTGAALAGATFALYADNEGSRGSAVVPAKSCTTDANGTCSITNILPPATYWVHETFVPQGYDAADDQMVTLGLDQVMQITFVDERKPIGITVDKQVDGQDPTQSDPLYVEGGSLVHYTLTIGNTGQLPLTISSLTDSLYPSIGTCAVDVTIPIGESYTCSYSSAVDRLAHNTASVSARDLLHRTVSASDDTWVQPIHPAVAIAKGGPTAAHVGDGVTYTLLVTNPGDTGLTSVEVHDPKCDDAPALQSKANGNDDAMLEPGETWTYTCSHTVTSGDGATVVNVATVEGTDRLDTKVHNDARHTLDVLHPAITITKTPDPVSVSGSGIVTYTYVVTNSGDTQLTNVTVDDDILGVVGVIATLDPGASVTLTKQTLITPSSPTVNVGTATGSDRLGTQVSAKATASVTVVLAEALELPRTGGSIAIESFAAAVLFGVGLALIVPARRRRRRSPVT